MVEILTILKPKLRRYDRQYPELFLGINQIIGPKQPCRTTFYV